MAFLAALAVPSLALAADPAIDKPAAPAPHTVTLTDTDLRVLSFALPRVGRTCTEEEAACIAQPLANRLMASLNAQLAAEAKQAAAKADAKK